MSGLTFDQTRAIARALNLQLFDRHSGDAKYNAQQNLAGRSHYADTDTLKYFHSRITSARVMENGAVFVLIESAAKDHENKSRGFRFVAFDLSGMTLNDRKDAFHSTSAKAEKAMWEWLESFDVVAHYHTRLADLADRAERKAAGLRAMSAALVTA